MLIMHTMNMDLNLLVALEALLAERSVTRAAARLGLSQPATSHALGRLRELVGDPLLVRGPRGAMIATPRAEALALPLARALEEVRRLLEEEKFDPRTTRRSFRIATSDYGELVVLSRLLPRLGPGIDLLVYNAGDIQAQLADGTTDMVIAPFRDRAQAGIYAQRLFDERFVCVVREGHPVKKMTLARFLELSHVLISPRGTRGGIVDDELEKMGKRRRIAVAVPHFLVAPHLVAASDHVLTLAERVARTFAPALGLRVMAPPLELPGFTMSLVWHERTHKDPAHRWLRREVESASRA